MSIFMDVFTSASLGQYYVQIDFFELYAMLKCFSLMKCMFEKLLSLPWQPSSLAKHLVEPSTAFKYETPPPSFFRLIFKATEVLNCVVNFFYVIFDT